MKGLAMRFARNWKSLGLTAVVAAGAATGVIFGCSGGSGLPSGGFGGGQASQLTGRLTNETVPLLLADFGIVYGSKDFIDAIDNTFSQLGVLTPSQSRTRSLNSLPATKQRTPSAAALKALSQTKASIARLQNMPARTGKNAATPSLDNPDIIDGCPIIVKSTANNPNIYSFTYNQCTPPGMGQTAYGNVTFEQNIFGEDLSGRITHGNNRYAFTSLSFNGRIYDGLVGYEASPGGNVIENGQPNPPTEYYTFRNMRIDQITYDGQQELRYSNGPRAGEALVDMTIVGNRATVKWGMELNFDASYSTGAANTIDVDAKLTGTATANRLEGDENAKGTYRFDLTNVVAKDACDSANSGSMIIKGANGEARVTFGPGCGQGRFSINNGPEVPFDAAQMETTARQSGKRK
jgi:hypothetical protein